MKSTLILLTLLFVSSYTAFAQRSFSRADIDGQSGLCDCRNRVLDPETGTFLQKDPIGITGGLNTYRYCECDPINGLDPEGLDSINNVCYFLTGVADAVSFGAGPWLRNNLDLNSGVDTTSGYYSGGHIAGSVVAGAAVGAGGAALIIRGAPLVVSGLISAGASPIVAGAAVDTGLYLGAAAGGAATAVNSISAIQEGNWDALAFNIGTLGGGALVGMSPFGGSASGGRYMSDMIGEQIPGVGASGAGPQNSLSDAFAYSKISQFDSSRGDGSIFTKLLNYWGAGPDPFGAGVTSTLIASGTASLGYSYFTGTGLGQFLPVGGVLLDKAATLVGQNLSDITGAMYDPVSGQFVFLGTNNPAPIKNINLDYLYTALQAVYGSATPPFVTLEPSASAYTPWTDFGNGNGIFEPGEQGGFTVHYNPIWDKEDTTVDVMIYANWSGTSYKWKARFNCQTNGSLAGSRNMMQMVFSNWVADANSTLPPSGISLNTSFWTLGTYGGSYALTPSSQDSYIPFLLNNGTANNYIVNSVMVVPARQHRKFGGRVENSKVGWVMEEADRVMKCLAVGTDNITNSTYSSATTSPNLHAIPGYSNMVERLTASGNSKGLNTRFWFTPNQMTLQRYIDPNTGLASIVFTNSTVALNTESLMLGLPQTPESKAFADNFTTNYDKFAALQFPCYDPNDPTGHTIIKTNIFGMLRDVMKAVSLARFFRDNGVPVDMWWLNSWQCPVAYAPKSVPTAANVSGTSGLVIYGGVNVNLPNTYIPSDTASNVAAVIQSSRPDMTGNTSGDIQQQVWTNSTTIGSMKAVGVNATAEPQDGNINLFETDLSFASPGGMSLRFARYYQSSWLGSTALGRGWRYLPVELQFERPSWFDADSMMRDASSNVVAKLSNGDTCLRSGTIRVTDVSSGATLDFNSSLVLGYAVDNTGNASISVFGLTNGVPTFSAGLRQNGATLIQRANDLSYQLTMPDGSAFIFDHNGCLQQTQGRYGRKQIYTYDGSGHLRTIMDDAWQSISLAYDITTNYITSITGPVGEQVVYAYNTNGCLTSATHVRSGAYVSYQYNTNLQIIGKTLFNGQTVVQSQPDLKGRANSKSDYRSNSLASTFTQDRAGLVRTNETKDPLVTDAQFVSNRRQFDRSGRLLTSRGVTGAETSYGYNAGSLSPNKVALPIAGRPPITIQRDTKGRPTRVSDPGNVGAQDVTAAYDPNTQMLQQVSDEGGRTTRMVYNANNSVSHIQGTHNGQNVDVGFGYTASGVLSQITNPLGITAVTVNRDSLDRVSSVVDATGVTINYQYDSLGRLSKLTDPQLTSPVVYVYDNFDRVTEIHLPYGTNYFSYNPVKGWLISQTDMLGRVTRYDHDPITGDILQIVQIIPGGVNLVTTMSYDRFGNLLSITPPQSATITYNYDSIGRQTGAVYSGVYAPGAPNLLKCNFATNGQPTYITNLLFSWSPPTSSVGVRGYSYAIDQMPGNVTNTVVTNATVNSVKIGTHLFQVRAQGTNGMWGPTADFTLIVTWVPGTHPPDAPPGLVCDHASSGVPTFYTNVVFSWQIPNSENGVAGYSYALNGSPDMTVDTTTTSASVMSVPIGTNTFQVMAKGSNGVWGATSSFQLIRKAAPDWSSGTTLNIGGSTACANLIYDRIQYLYDPGYMRITSSITVYALHDPQIQGVPIATNQMVTFQGTMNAKIPNLGGFPVVTKCHFCGSIEALNDLYFNPGSDHAWFYYHSMDIVVSDVDPVSVIPSLYEDDIFYDPTGYDLDQGPIMSVRKFAVIPFVFVRNNAIADVNNITSDQAKLLMSSSGAISGQPFHGMTAAYLGGTGNTPMYLIGASSFSGTRMNVEKYIGYVGNPVLWATNGTGQYVIQDGYLSEYAIADVISAKPDAIGYLDLADYSHVFSSAMALNYNGVACTAANVANGSYELWNYATIVSSAYSTILRWDKAFVRDALVGALTDPVFQSSPLFNNGFLPLSGMQVLRLGGDTRGQIYPNTYW